MNCTTPEPHDPRLSTCPVCGGDLRLEHSRHIGDYEWCPRCRSAVWCACEVCETFRCLRDL
jgi:hypothetical protein